jgi:hypothetical protein
MPRRERTSVEFNEYKRAGRRAVLPRFDGHGKLVPFDVTHVVVTVEVDDEVSRSHPAEGAVQGDAPERPED